MLLAINAPYFAKKRHVVIEMKRSKKRITQRDYLLFSHISTKKKENNKNTSQTC